MNNWNNCTLGDVAKYSNTRVSTEELSIDNYVSTENMIPNRAGKSIASSIPNGNAIRYCKGQTLISNIRPYFKKIWHANMNGGCSADVLVFETIDEIDEKYFYYYVSQDHFFEYVMAGSKGTKMPRGDKQQILKYPFFYPGLREQKAIAETLSCLDDKIELSSRINKNLEEMAQVIFKSWFVDFEPFQDGEFEDTKLGKIPKGWSVLQLKDVSDFQNGYAFYKVGYSDSGAMVIDLGNVDLLGNFVKTKADKFISTELYSQPKMEKFHVLKDDLIIIMTDRKSTMDLLGKTAKISNDGQYILNQRVGRIRPNDNINANFLYTYLNSEPFLNELKKRALGSVQKYVNTNNITDSNFIIPNNTVMTEFGNMINPIFEQMEALNCENQILNTIRDTLLPKLMSGEIRIPIKEVQ